jgi:hypothetical protein
VELTSAADEPATLALTLFAFCPTGLAATPIVEEKRTATARRAYDGRVTATGRGHGRKIWRRRAAPNALARVGAAHVVD